MDASGLGSRHSPVRILFSRSWHFCFCFAGASSDMAHDEYEKKKHCARWQSCFSYRYAVPRAAWRRHAGWCAVDAGRLMSGHTRLMTGRAARALDAGPRALDAGPRALYDGPRALDAWQRAGCRAVRAGCLAARWMPAWGRGAECRAVLARCLAMRAGCWAARTGCWYLAAVLAVHWLVLRTIAEDNAGHCSMLAHGCTSAATTNAVP